MDKLESILLSVQKPSRYTGGEVGSIAKAGPVQADFAFCFPDVYDVGMSHLGMKILYSLINADERFACERVFAPWPDMEEQMRKNEIPLYSLETRKPVKDFDFIGFTLQYELSYTNILNMLDLSGLPVHASERTGLSPLVVAGGPCAYNPEPLADFIDLFILGEGEEVNLELMECYCRVRDGGGDKAAFLREAAKIQGIYVPALYQVEYNEDGTLHSFTPKEPDVPARVRKRIIKDIDKVFYPEKFVLPFCEIVHDRSMLEVFRGCIRGCRFCQAGMVYRPVREKSPERLLSDAQKLYCGTGYDEISLTSLSTSDYSGVEELIDGLLEWGEPKRISVSLPSLRVDNFSAELTERLQKVRKSGLTFAPEAGSQRLRDVINKNVTREDLIRTCTAAFEGGWSSIKLYFMMGLPTETPEDVVAIGELAQEIVDLYYQNKQRPKGRGVSVSASVASFVPKPFTPFQWEPQDTMEMLREKQKLLTGSVKSKKVSLSWHDARVSVLEAVLARGDRRVAPVIEKAWRLGCTFDGWDEYYRFDRWMEAFGACGVDTAFYANRRRELTELLPWDFIDVGVSRRFLEKERELAYAAATTPNCREQCSGCGASALLGGACFAER